MKKKKEPTYQEKLGLLIRELGREQEKCKELERELEAESRKSTMFEKRVAQLEAKFDSISKSEGINQNKKSVVEGAAYRALAELQTVQNGEKDIASLHRVIGSAQGALALALENSGRYKCNFVDLSPKQDKSDEKLNQIASVLRDRY